MTTYRISIIRALADLTSATDLSNRQISDHSVRVGYLCHHLGRALGFGEAEQAALVRAALLHDVGVSSTKEKLSLVDIHDEDAVSRHSHRGHALLKDTGLFGGISTVVLHHHVQYQRFCPEIPMASYLIHLADRVEIYFDRLSYSLTQVESIRDTVVGERAQLFHPEAVDAFLQVASTQSLWLDLETGLYRNALLEQYGSPEDVSYDELLELSRLFAQVIDDKSPFTATHSRGVSSAAVKMAILLEFAPVNHRMMVIASLLHDVGKLAIPDEILEYPGALNRTQRLVMQQHTYHTFHLLGWLQEAMPQVPGWAAYHHERLDGSGYPFALRAEELDKGARMLAVADMLHALIEARPYRPGMSKDKTVAILMEGANTGHLDKNIVQLAVDAFDWLVADIDDPLAVFS